ncbi:MAG: ribosome small subunit-dependent GTPase A [Planctomycetes bacterium]|nr:ribosome small subunit-dependent GTPase A [Planctomycetota bacterium]
MFKVEGPWSQVESDGLNYRCSLRKKVKAAAGRQTSPVVVGDTVQFVETFPGEGVIEGIQERRTKLSRLAPWAPGKEHVIVANMDQLLVVAATKDPPLKAGLIDRYIIAAENGGLRVALCVNKIDLVDEGDMSWVKDMYGPLGYPVLFTSAVKGVGIDELAGVLKDRKTVLAGQSGVGKSSLINRIQPGLGLRIQEIREAARKGKHTTSWVTLLGIDIGGYVVDTPGIRELGLWDIGKQDIAEFFGDIWEIGKDCHFSRCSHTHEPRCAVKTAVERGTLDKLRYESYLRILESTKENSTR